MTNRLSSFKTYDLDYRIAEIYDRTETQTEDIALLRELTGSRVPLKILEPFCGNGRILIPLARDGHEITGTDKSVPMLASARDKIKQLPAAVRARITLRRANVLRGNWPGGFDLVILGSNCLYELATPAQQESCIRFAGQSLKENGWLYLDNDHMEDELDPGWYTVGIDGRCFPNGKCSDGTQVKGSRETIWYDTKKRLVRFQRAVELITPGGQRLRKEWIEQKHPPSTPEMKGWLEKHGFVIENLWGDRKRSPYTDESARAVFRARLVKKG